MSVYTPRVFLLAGYFEVAQGAYTAGGIVYVDSASCLLAILMLGRGLTLLVG